MIKKCKWCNNSFETKYKTKQYCMPICSSKSRQKSSTEKSLKRNCGHCNNPYQSNDKRAKFCSQKCSHESQRKFLDIPSCLENANRKIDKNIGYVRVYCPMHPKANTWGYVYEHIVIAEQAIGRFTTKNEVVHHKNGIRWDNRPENLEVMDKHDHSKLNGQRPEDIGPGGESRTHMHQLA